MAINVSAQYNGGFLPDIIIMLLTLATSITTGEPTPLNVVKNYVLTVYVPTYQ